MEKPRLKIGIIYPKDRNRSASLREKEQPFLLFYSFIPEILRIFVEVNTKYEKYMANLRELKKEIDYRLEEVVFDCDMAICFQPSKEKEIFELMQQAVAVRNALFTKASNPAEPHNRSLVRKHYAALRAEMETAFGELFEKLSAINK